MAVCLECGEPVGPGLRPFVYGYAFARDRDGNWISGSEVPVGLFHPECWQSWKVKHPLPEDDPPDASQMIEDLGGGSPPSS